MNRRERRQQPAQPAGPVLMGFKVIHKLYSQVRAIFAETGQSDTMLKRALAAGHGITFDITEDPMLFFVVSDQQMTALARNGISSPTFMQLLGTCEVIATTEAEAIRRFRALKGDERAEDTK